jgi:pyridoxamine 5'-phosphate oxidase
MVEPYDLRCRDDPVVDDLSPRLSAMRRTYEGQPLDEADLAPGWLAQFVRWLDEAVAGGEAEPNAMMLATATPDGRPSARTVLLKALDERGFVFFTNLRSRKGREIAQNPRAALVFPWRDVRRQVVVEGAVEEIDAADSDAYFASRPRGAQLGALASPQSDVVASRAELERLRDAAEQGLDDAVARPGHWGGLRVVPDAVEFWQGRADRLHDRLRYRLAEDGRWVIERLAP